MFQQTSSEPNDREFLISTLSSPLMPASSYTGVSQREPFAGVELDLSESLRYQFQRWKSHHGDEPSPIRSIWFPANLERELPTRVVDLLAARGKDDPPVRLVIDLPVRRLANAATIQLETGIRMRHRFGELHRITLAVRPYHIESTRAHLAHVANLRLQVSEWDIDLALDLSRELDWLWEAEASVYRIFQSIAQIRLTYPTATFDGRFRASLTHRTIATCAELGYRGQFSLVAPLPWWHWRNAHALEAACRDAANGVERRFADPLGGSGQPLSFEASQDTR